MSRSGQLITAGAFYTAGMQLSSVFVVLPFICADRGTTWAAGLLFPAFSLGIAAGNSMSPLILNWSRHRRHLVLAAAAAAMAVLAASNAAVLACGTLLISAALLVNSAASGTVAGVVMVTFLDLLSGKVPEVRRGAVLLTQGAVGSVMATLITVFAVLALGHGDRMSGHVELLWLGVAGLGAAAVAAVLVGPVRTTEVTQRRPRLATYREGVIAARSQPWFRRYALIQLMFVPITLGTAFYSVRAAGHDGNLPVLVIVSSIGLLAASKLWRVVYRCYGVRTMLVGSALLSASAATICVGAAVYHQWSHVWVHAIVVLLSTLATPAVSAAAISWISVCASDKDRAALISFGAILVAVTSAAAGLVLGACASNPSAMPAVMMLGLTLVAAAAALRAPGRPGAQSDQIGPVAATAGDEGCARSPRTQSQLVCRSGRVVP